MSPSPSVGDEGIDERGVCYGWRARRSSSSSASPSVTHRHATVGRSKNGASRLVPMNAVVRSVLIDAATRRKHPNDPDASIFAGAYRTVARAFTQAVSRAQAALRASGKDATRLDGYTWHSNRHTFASRLVMAGVDLRTVQELGGWKTLSMVLFASRAQSSSGGS